MWALIIITISLRFSPKRIENFMEFNYKASELGYYASFDIRYIQKCDFTIKTLFPVQNKENDNMAGRRQRHQTATRNSNNNILNGATLLILISGDIAENPGPIKFPCGSCAKPVKKNQKGIQCEDCLFWHHIKCINLPVTDYITLSESSDSWYCSRCILPECTDSYLEKSLNESDIDKSADSDDYHPCDNLSTSDVSIPETHGHDNRDDIICDVFDQIKDLKRKHPNTLLTAYLNINSFRYRYCHIKELLVNNTVDVLFLAETKIDGTFCDAQFTVDNYHFWRKNRTTHGGLAVYVRSDLPCDRKNKVEFQCIESISVEIKIGSDKWLIIGVYRPQTINEKDFNNDFIKTCHQITTKYDNCMFIGDMNYDMLVSEKSSALANMCDIFDLHNLVKNLHVSEYKQLQV
jgi:hypothetical protein